MSTKITFNGTVYNSPDEMPDSVREAYERAMAMLKSDNAASPSGPRVNIKFATRMRFVHDGKVYNSLDEMPPELRAKYQNAVQQVDKDHDGIPDFLEATAGAGMSRPSVSSEPEDVEAGPIAPVTQAPAVIQPETSNRALLMIAGVIILLLLLVVVGLLAYITSH